MTVGPPIPPSTKPFPTLGPKDPPMSLMPGPGGASTSLPRDIPIEIAGSCTTNAPFLPVTFAARRVFGGAGGAGADGGVRILVLIHRNRGGTCTHSSGTASKILNASACIVNDANALQRRRPDRSQVVSKV